MNPKTKHQDTSVQGLTAKMSMRINPPDYIKCKNYERYKQELLAWKRVTEVDKKKQAIAIALSLPADGEEETGIREKVFEELKLEDLEKDNGLDTLIAFFDKHLGKDDLSDSFQKFEEFEECIRRSESIRDYIQNFDQKYNRLVKLNMTLPKPIVAFKLLKGANISKEQRMLVLTGLDFDNKEGLYEQAKASLKKYLGDNNKISNVPMALKVESTHSTDQEALVASNYTRRPWQTRGGFANRPMRGGNHWRGSYQPQTGRGYHSQGSNTVRGKKMNPAGSNGRPLLCKSCGSFRHLLSECPDSYERMPQVHWANDYPNDCHDYDYDYPPEDDNIEENEDRNEDADVFFANNRHSMKELSIESRNCAVLDSGCSSNVCGQAWFDCYVDSLSSEERRQVIEEEGRKTFKFGGGEKLKSLGCFFLPAHLAGKKVTIKTDVVASNLPLLLSKEAMKKAKVKLNLIDDTAEILGKEVCLNHTSSGHYCVPLDKVNEVNVEEVYAVNINTIDKREQRKTLTKLHRQFAHPSAKKFVGLLKDGGVWSSDLQEEIDAIYKSCNLCRVYSKTPARPAVALPMASDFNEKVCMDLNQWNNKWILHLVDMFSRFTVSVFINRKRPRDIIDKMIKCWIGVFGVMGAVLTDNGGEFSSEEMREIASILNVEVLTTAAESPFQNGLCEKNHAIVDTMLMKMQDEYQHIPLDVLLCWSSMAKNAMQMWNGFSSYQIVFGRNPKLPNIMSDNIPALQGKTGSEVLAMHLNALHSARKHFIMSEADERIRRALRCKIRASEQVFHPGDRVFYKREGKEKWLGPAKVVCQDGKIVFIRHGGVFIRVSPNRLLLAGREYFTDSGEMHDHDMSMRSKTKDHGLAEYIGAEQKQPRIENETQEQPRIETQEQPNIETDRDNLTTVTTKTNLINLQRNDRIKYKLEVEDEWKESTILCRGGKRTGQNKNWFNIKDSTTDEVIGLNLDTVAEWQKVKFTAEGNKEQQEVNIVIVPREKHEEEATCVQAKLQELQKLKAFSTYESVPNKGQTTISTRWILSRKGDEVKARLVARGFEDQEIMRKDAPTVGKSMMRTMIAIAATNSWSVKTTDIKSAFLQGRDMEREVYIKPPKEADVENGMIWKLKKCLYGLNEAARQFYQSVADCLLSLGCTKSALDPALFYMKKDGQLKGIIACHIDDFLHAGDEEFDECMTKMRKQFLAGKLEMGQFKYIGFNITQNDHHIIIDQTEYVKQLENATINAQRRSQKSQSLNATESTTLRELVGRLNWVAQGSRPDIFFEMIELSTRLNKGTVNDLTRAIKAVKNLKEEKAVVMMPKLHKPSNWRLVVFSDASHANLSDGANSMGAHLVFLTDGDRSCPISWHAGKIKRVVRSTIAAETLSLLEAVENGIYIREHLMELLGLSIPLHAYIDNKSLVEAVHSTKLVDDKRLRIDMSSLQESLSRGEINTIQWIPGDKQLANCLTKKGASPYHLLQAMQNGYIQIPWAE